VRIMCQYVRRCAKNPTPSQARSCVLPGPRMQTSHDLRAEALSPAPAARTHESREPSARVAGFRHGCCCAAVAPCRSANALGCRPRAKAASAAAVRARVGARASHLVATTTAAASTAAASASQETLVGGPTSETTGGVALSVPIHTPRARTVVARMSSRAARLRRPRAHRRCRACSSTSWTTSRRIPTAWHARRCPSCTRATASAK
jgi:hypothetical protein